jgi:phenylpropionate dioxygenase-like ring-hydroxylating dioxygenase large terminal subunit
MEPVEARDFHFPVNWKVSLENALDYYHVSTVHPKTVGAHVDAEPTFTDMGWHSLQTLYIAPYGWREKLDRHCARQRPYSDHELSSLHKYFVFPNLVINVLPYHLTVMQFFPDGPTNCIMRYRFCQRR